ncbi:MAG: TIGR03905 family TSCPD domain-containing protein [Oscillospiraceae bacterium]
MTYDYKTKGTCSRSIKLTIDDNGIITNVIFIGGCNGNLNGISSLVIGQNAEDIAKKLKGISCNGKGTSCPDQLSIAINEALSKR